jgi:hypothetical protein
MKSSFKQGDVPGANADSLKKGPQTTRMTCPLSGDYQLPGHTELESKDPYAKSKKDKIKPTSLGASGAKQMGIKSRASSPAPYGLDADMTAHNQVGFKKSYGEFYGVDQNSAAKIDYNALHKASRTKISQDPARDIPSDMKASRAFKQNEKKFFSGAASDCSSAYRENAGKFYADASQNGRVNAGNTIGGSFQGV